jgi:hypothetical protein
MEKQLKATILDRRTAQGPRKKPTQPEPRQYTVADLERARGRVAAAERRIRQRPQKAVPTGDTRGWSRRSSHCLTSSRNYACAASLSDQRHPIIDIAAQLEIHAKQELDHALILSRQIDYLGKMPVVTLEPVSPLARLA